PEGLVLYRSWPNTEDRASEVTPHTSERSCDNVSNFSFPFENCRCVFRANRTLTNSQSGKIRLGSDFFDPFTFLKTAGGGCFGISCRRRRALRSPAKYGTSLVEK